MQLSRQLLQIERREWSQSKAEEISDTNEALKLNFLFGGYEKTEKEEFLLEVFSF